MAGDPDNQKTPLASRAIPKSHAPPSTPSKHHSHHKKADKSPVYILAFFVLISLILLITFSVILRVTSPNLNLTITSLKHFNVTSSSSLNVTLLTDLTISNRNHGPYSYEKCKALIYQNDVMIGGGDVSGGVVEARSRKAVSVAMSFESNESKDLVEIFVFVKMSGRVRVLKVRNRAKTVEMNCTVRIDVMRRFVTSSLC